MSDAPVTPLVTVVLPVFNGGRWLRETLASVLGQEGFDSMEVVAIDDGSTDDSAAVIESVGDPRVRLTRRENRGISVTRNEAIRQGRGRYVAFIDQDDLWRPDKLARQIPQFEEDASVGLVHCQCARVDSEGRRISGGPIVSPDRLSGDVRRGMLLGNVVPGTAGVVVRRECFDTVGFFDEGLDGADDWEMWARIATRYAFRFDPEPLAFTRLHAWNTSTDVDRMRSDGRKVQEMLFADPRMTEGLTDRERRRHRRRARGSLHGYCATWLIRTGRTRAAAADLARAVLYQPMKPRYLVLLLFSLVGWVPGVVRRRLI
jgi:glycosyltransferase involved in cell wall biosynthesis